MRYAYGHFVFMLMNMHDLFLFDSKMTEWINNHRIKVLDDFFLSVTNTAWIVVVLITVVLLCIDLYRNNKVLRIQSFQIVTALICNLIVVIFLKYTVNRMRPFVTDVLIEKLSAESTPSFPSGHTASAFVIAIFFSLLLPGKTGLKVAIWIWAVIVAYSRIYLGVHYISDVFASVMIGCIISIIVHKFFSKYKFIQHDRTIKKLG